MYDVVLPDRHVIDIQTSSPSVTDRYPPALTHYLPPSATAKPAPGKNLLPIDLLPPRLEKLPLPRDAPIPQPHMLPRAHPQQHLNHRPTRRPP